jgi:hypothetical protein
MKFNVLHLEGRDTDALRLMAREQYENGRIGHARMSLMVRVADELDEKTRELSFSRGKTQKQSVRDFLADMANNEILQGKKYSVRIEIDDGGINSYIGFDVAVEDWAHRPRKATERVSIYRHTNSANKLENEWCFSLGNVCHPYVDMPNIPMQFSSYGKTADEAEAEAAQYFNDLKKLIRKKTSGYKIEAAESAKDEREKLLARLSELDGPQEAGNQKGADYENR